MKKYMLKTLKVSLAMLAIFVGFSLIFIYTGFALNIIWAMFSPLISPESVLLQLAKINFEAVIKTAILVYGIFFIAFSFAITILGFFKMVHLIKEKTMNKFAFFLVKILLALYPTVVLATTLNEHLFSLVTSVISFFVIFTFVFKHDLF